MARKKKEVDNVDVANWIIEHKKYGYAGHSVDNMLPQIVDDAVYAAVYTVAGSSSGTVNVDPSLVFKALMLKTLSTASVKPLEVGHTMSDRQAQRLVQTAAYAARRISEKMKEYDEKLSQEKKNIMKMEKEFATSWKEGNSSLYSEKSPPIPQNILDLYFSKKYIEYSNALIEWRKSL